MIVATGRRIEWGERGGCRDENSSKSSKMRRRGRGTIMRRKREREREQESRRAQQYKVTAQRGFVA